jgi:hypothetical protein
MEVRQRLEVPDVLHAARAQIIQNEHIVASCQKRLGKVRSDESRATCNQNTH